MRSEIKMYKIPRKTSNFPWDDLLFANLNSTVPSYADKFKLTKYNFLFRNLPACRWVYRHAAGGHGSPPLRYYLDSKNTECFINNFQLSIINSQF